MEFKHIYIYYGIFSQGMIKNRQSVTHGINESCHLCAVVTLRTSSDEVDLCILLCRLCAHTFTSLTKRKS